MFDLSMQSALDIFCYVLVLIYGLMLSADISTGGYVSRQQKCLLTLLCLLFLLVQGLGLVLLGERTVKQLYPLVTHVPLVLILILFMKKSVGVAIVSTCTAYLCCQPPRWGRIAVEALTQSTLAAELVYILLMPVMYQIPSDPTIIRVTVDEDAVNGGQPKLEYGAVRKRYKNQLPVA